MSVRDVDAAYAELLDLLLSRSLEGWHIPDLITEMVGRLQALGIPLYRVHIGIPMLHPLYSVGAYTWFPGRGVEVDTYARGPQEESVYRQSPVRPIFESGASEGRVRIRAGSESDRYAMFVRAAAEGGTDYFVQLVGFSDRSRPPAGQEGIALSWISADPEGFGEPDIALLRRLVKPISAELKSLTHKRLVADILHAYLGPYSADRVYSGQIQRGDGDVIDAVILFCDLRGSSKLAEHYDLDGFLAVLNDYYEITAGAVIAGGGEVLRYIGDASLAVFPIERYGSERDACQAAIDTAFEAARRCDRVNAERTGRGEVPIEFGIGLHVGPVMYGNIGTRERIEFTVIGRAANETARIEAKCKDLGERILVSGRFAAALPMAYRSLGDFSLRNIGEPMEILTPA